MDDLVQLFTEALAQTSDAAPGSSLQQQQTQAPQDDPEAGTVASSVRGRGSVVGGMSTKYTKGAAAETFAFKQAQTLAAKLVMVSGWLAGLIGSTLRGNVCQTQVTVAYITATF